MPRIVGLIAKVGADVDSHGLNIEAMSLPTSVHFVGGATARLALGDPRATAYTLLLEHLRRESLPVYADVDSAAFVNQLLVPLVVKVRDWRQLPSGDVTVDLQPSHATHILRAGSPGFDANFDAVKRARQDNLLVSVTETPRAPEILDVTPTIVPLFDWDSNLEIVGHQPLHAEVPASLAASVTTVTPAEAHELFTALQGKHCDATAHPASCIPFNFPDDGCHARAHCMCELLLKRHDVRAGKIWLFGDPYPEPATLHPRTRNNPRCKVLWRYHVAPFLQVEAGGSAEVRVIDPALFDTPVSKERWREVQRDPRARFDFTDTSIYDRPETGEVYRDADFSATPRDLKPYRHGLAQRVIEEGGGPPYC